MTRDTTDTRRGKRTLQVAALAAAVLLAAGAAAYAVLRPAPSAPARVTAVAGPPKSSRTPARLAPVAPRLAQRAQEAVTRQEAHRIADKARTEQSKKAAAAASAPATTNVAVPPAYHALPFDAGQAMVHVKTFSETIGVRVGGTTGESRAIEYARKYLASLGYEVAVTPVPLPNGRTSHNVAAKMRGATGPIVVLGGHIDSKSPAPGADDNASGCGTVLELARDYAKTKPKADLRFVLFGTEELIGDGDSNHHHFGSRAYVKALPASERSRFAAMVSIDMIGYGPDFVVRTMGVGTRSVADRLLAAAKGTRAPLSYLRDPGSSGWSDHEPFERAGLPAAWLEWRDNPNAHTARDSYGRLKIDKVRTTGVLVRAWLESLTADDLAKLVAL